MVGALRVFAGLEAEVEVNRDQVSDVVGSDVRGGSFLGDDGVHDSQRGGLFMSGRGIFEPKCLEFPCEALVKPSVCLVVSRFSGFRRTIQEVGCCNFPPCLRNRFFPRLVHPALEVLGVPNSVAVDLEELDVRGGWILESRIDQQGGTEVGPLSVQPLLSCILRGAGSHSFLRSVEITQESSSSGKREIFHKLCDWGWATDMWMRKSVPNKENKCEASSAMQFFLPGW